MKDEVETNKTWQVHHEDFKSILGSSPKLKLLLQIDNFPFAHEAGVFFAQTNELFVTSNQFKAENGETKVQISKISLESGTEPTKFENIECDLIHFANGGVNYKDGILFCAQGSGTSPSGLFHMQASPPYTTKPVLTSYLGTPLNSVNDVVVHYDGSIWFTDPSYGHDQGYRPRPSLPNQVYRYDPATESIRAVADGCGRPNGICFSPDQTTVYITDTDQVRGPWIDHTRAASIYAFDVIHRHGQPFLANRRLFAFADSGIPDGIKCDTAGNVYSGCPDGINVWSPGGMLLGKIVIPGGVANFCFGSDGQIFALNEYRLWRVQLSPNVRGALLATKKNN
ncbi:hypothetical protein FSARC_228 [Fusarium sarcochroum]|uniref:SMP-30/Gluconolactonase/LRE-like region domain-containing protein n=1 Tax=Fusarium sarcochroum TaxID=1208366 RepID=A0A8H4UCC3_9HYPO|nr:hypothetical protein FSARC_228 [Fusarium sarcochroum]